jgi:hypothetical protein
MVNRRPGCRAAHVPTAESRAMVTTASGFGTEQRFIAQKLGISPGTLEKHYRAELDSGASSVMAALAGSLFRRAMDPKSGMAGVTASIWLMKNIGGWRDRMEHSGPEGSPMTGGRQVRIYLPPNDRQRLALESRLIEGRP